jgi:hypothetical protein
MKMTPEERAAYKEAQNAEWRSRRTTSTALRKGEEKGLEKANKATIANLHKAGQSIEIMAIATGLTQDQIQEIINTINQDAPWHAQ